MAIVEQIRERQQEMADQFDSQTIPAHHGQVADTNKRALEKMLRDPESTKSKRKRPKNALPPPSKAVQDFLVHALNDPNFRRFMEHLANQ